MKNPKMKAMASMLFNYFLIRGVVDKVYNSKIELVKFICPSNKLKVNEQNTLEVFKKGDSKKKYKMTKELGKVYTKKLLKFYPEKIKYLEGFKKQDDLCDSFLQG